MTSLDVLNILIEQHRLCSPLDFEADPSIELSFDSTIEEWRYANDLLEWYPLSAFLNKSFDLTITSQEWKSLLTQSSVKTLKGVCDLISKYSQHTHIQPIKLFGQDCLSAAIFLTLKKYLRRREVDVSELKPSSLITPYFEKYFSPMIEQTTIVATGGKVFDQLAIKRKKAGLLNYINIFDKNRYTFLTGEIKTFRDLTLKIIEIKGLKQSCK